MYRKALSECPTWVFSDLATAKAVFSGTLRETPLVMLAYCVNARTSVSASIMEGLAADYAFTW